MDDHKCIIGVLYHVDYSDLCTLDDLKDHIKERKEYNDFWRNDPVYGKLESYRVKQWTLKDYADKRRNTNLTRFYYCPTCGEKIDWKKIKEA